MAKEMEKEYARTETLRKIRRAVVALTDVKGDGLYRDLPATYSSSVDTELRHLDKLEGRLRAWAITEAEVAAAGQEQQANGETEAE